MSHPIDTKAWETLDRFDPEFARDPMSVRIGLSTDGLCDVPALQKDG
jgi:hypothetical protein